MEELVGFIEERSPQIVSEYRKKLETKMAEVLADTTIDENRIAAEVILYADKICVDEETVRLRSHIAHARQCLSEDGGIGRKLDFIAQEMNREANTTLSKANDIEISNAAIDLHEMKDFCIITCTLLRKCIYLYLVQACMCVEAIY